MCVDSWITERVHIEDNEVDGEEVYIKNGNNDRLMTGTNVSCLDT